MNNTTTAAQTEALVRMAHVWSQRENLSRAAALYAEAIARDRENLQAWLGLAIVRIKEQDLAAARRLLDDWAASHPRERFLSDSLAVFEQLGTPGTAAGQLAGSLGDQIARLSGQDCDVLLYSDSAGGTSGVAQMNQALATALQTAQLQVVCAQPGDEPLAAGLPHLRLPAQNIYDPNLFPSFLNAAHEPQLILDALHPRLLVFADGSPMSNLAAKAVARARGVPYVSIIHCVNPNWALDYAAYAADIATGMREAAAVLTVSQTSLNQLEDHFGLPQGCGKVVLNGRPGCFFAPPDPQARRTWRTILDIPPDALVCLTIARLERYKGHPLIFEAMRQLRNTPAWPKLAFVWVGIGTQALAYRLHANDAGFDEHIRFAGRQEDIPGLLAAADLCIHPSHFEGMPLSVLEAMAGGLPVLATAVSGTPEALGECGVLLPDPAAPGGKQAVAASLAAGITRLAADPAARAALGSCAAQRARQYFTLERMQTEITAILLPLLEARYG